jgi:Lon protease-like protein
VPLHAYGVAATVVQLARSMYPRLCYTLLLEGRCRFAVLRTLTSEPFLCAHVRQMDLPLNAALSASEEQELRQLSSSLKEAVGQLIELIRPEEDSSSGSGAVVADDPARASGAGGGVEAGGTPGAGTRSAAAAAAARLKQLAAMLQSAPAPLLVDLFAAAFGPMLSRAQVSASCTSPQPLTSP